MTTKEKLPSPLKQESEPQEPSSITPEDLQEVERLLAQTSADDYGVWIETGCALKRFGVPYDVFRKWSAKSKKFDEDECAKKWDDLPGIPRAGWPTLRKNAAASSFVPVPEAMLPEPQTEDECAAQAAHFIFARFKPGEEFELCHYKKAPHKENHLIPARYLPLPSLGQEDTEESLAQDEKLRTWLRGVLNGVVVSQNPVKVPPDYKGHAPADALVTRHDYALFECDELLVDVQWTKLREMRLPIVSVVNSAGKSLHVECHIGAGPDAQLYKERVKKLYDYVRSFGFKLDEKCKNASRLTRLPGALRDGKRQYLVCGPCGYPDWNSFEAGELRSDSAGTRNQSVNGSASNALQGEEKLLDELKSQYGVPFTLTNNGAVRKLTERFWAAYVMRKHELYKGDGVIWQYDDKTGLWNMVGPEDLNDLIGSTAHAYGTAYGYEELDPMFDLPHCERLQGFMRNSKEDPFKGRPKNAIHVANGVVEIRDDGTCVLKDFAREYYSRNQCPFPFDPKAQCPRFMTELLEPVFEQDDIGMVQLMFGQALLAYNLRQKFFILTGTPGGGKGTIVNIMRSIIGPQNCAELHTKLLGTRFETGGYIGKSMLFGNDVPTDFLLCENADCIKKLTGGDPNEAELKGINERVQIEGCFNMVITSNGRLLVKVDDDLAAWERRMEVLQLIGEATKTPDPFFAENLLKEEGAGIVNWAIEGAARVFTEGFPKESFSRKRVKKLLLESNSIVGFLGTAIEKSDSGPGIAINELMDQYVRWCQNNDWVPLVTTENKRKLKQGLETRFHVTESHSLKRTDTSGNETEVRGYNGIRFKEQDNQ